METRPSILIVDDTPANIKMLVGILRDEYTLAVATGGQAALDAAQANPPDLVLLDVMMPEMDGYEVLKRLKDSQATAAVPVIFITALTDAEDEAKGRALGAMDYIGKPFQADTVLSTLARHLGRG